MLFIFQLPDFQNYFVQSPKYVSHFNVGINETIIIENNNNLFEMFVYLKLH